MNQTPEHVQPLSSSGRMSSNQVEFISLALLISATALDWVPAGWLVLCMAFAYLMVMHGDFYYRSYLTLNRDLRGLYLLLAVKFDLNRRWSQNRGIPDIFMEVARRTPHKPAITDIATRRTLTFLQFNRECNRVANYFQSLGYRKGDTVALFMENSIDFVAVWMGLAKIGVATAWINTNLRMEPLAHCVQTSEAKCIVTSATLQTELQTAIDRNVLDATRVEVFVKGGEVLEGLRARQLDELFASSSGDEPQRKDTVDFKSVLCFIYTSGTTGMPKAAVMKHFRYYSMVMGSAKSFRVRPSDRIYISMPMYHTAAGIIGVGQMLLTGSSCVIRKKFSASNFWKDCVQYNCTTSQYIGEICRYLLAQPVCPEEKQHKMRLMYGNGLRSEIWKKFVERFNIQIGEVYGSTEGTSNLVNIDGHIGACGFLPISPLTARMHPVRLIKVDEVTGEIVRGSDGLCIPCVPGETGAMVSSIRKNNPLLVFEGYLNRSETSKKVIRDVFRRGDSVFVSGDILRWDRLGYVYFKDRTGDTFRWKGENVSTTEVEAIIHPLPDVDDATVYGVTIPGMEGRAGMAAVVKSRPDVPDSEFLAELARVMQSSLPAYAVPVFIRLCSAVDRTGTFKLVKTRLQQLGYKPQSDDRVFYFDNASKAYVQLSDAVATKLDRGLVKNL
uniref:Very long-chain fatty acid transport protein n=1 Tax=Steinernema glaseri TaxID=37863 RepID=A0A1I7YHW0_9BILA